MFSTALCTATRSLARPCDAPEAARSCQLAHQQHQHASAGRAQPALRTRAPPDRLAARRSAFLAAPRTFVARRPTYAAPAPVAVPVRAALANELTPGKALVYIVLGPEPEARAAAAMAIARKFATEGKRTLVAVQQLPLPKFYEGLSLSLDSTDVAPNIAISHLKTTSILERGWELTKELEQKYLAVPFQRPGTSAEVFGVELPVLPGMDGALGLAALWQIDRSGKYDAIVYDGTGDLAAVRVFAAAEVSDWYVRRFRRVVEESDVFRTLLPFVQAATAAVVAPSAGISSSASLLDQGEALLKRLTAAYKSPEKLAAFLVAGPATAPSDLRFLWGAAMQAGLVVGGVLAPGGSAPDAAAFAPLPVTALSLPPAASADGWEAAVASLPDLPAAAAAAPRPVQVDAAGKRVVVFLPGFAKGQVRLSQSGPELTIEAGDQRRNLFLPPALKSLPVKAAKFEEPNLVITF